jgi:hypothetical protein
MANRAFPGGALETTASKSGNSGHVVVPKAWIGEEVVVIRKADLAAAIVDVRSDGKRPPGLIRDRNTRLAYLEDDSGESMVFEYNVRTDKCYVYDSEANWQKYQLYKIGGDEITVIAMNGKRTLPMSTELKVWLMSCINIATEDGVSHLPHAMLDFDNDEAELLIEETRESPELLAKFVNWTKLGRPMPKGQPTLRSGKT